MNDFIKVLRRYLPPYKKEIILNVLFNILTMILNVFSFASLYPILQILFRVNPSVSELSDWNTQEGLVNNIYYYISFGIDTFGQSVALVWLGLFLVIMTFLKTASAYFASHFIIPIRTGVVRDIRMSVFDKILTLPIGFFSSERKGDIMARMTGDVAEIETSITSSLDMLFKNPILILGYLSVMLFISWELTLFVLILLPISGYVMGRVGKKLKRSSLEAQNHWGALMSQIDESLGGLRIIKAFNAEGKIEKRFLKQNNVFRKATNRISRRQALAHPMSEFLGTTTISIVLWYGGTLILSGSDSINAASFMYYLVMFYSIINPAKDLSKAIYSIQRGMASIERVDKILAADNPIKIPENPRSLTSFERDLRFENVSFRYVDKWVLDHVNLTIEKGKSVALVGQSGSGKSTLVDMIPRFYDVEKGSIKIDGIDIREFRPYDLRSLMGNVNQEAILFNDTFLNNIAFGVNDATMEQVIESAKIANAHEFIIASEDGYETNIGDRGCRLSGGQRQRLSIARAILKNPPILILDEATSALDTESERLVQDALEKLMKNRTTLVIAHRLSTIRNADLICVMNEGRIVEQGTHDQLIEKDGFYKRLCDMQSF